MSALSFMSDNKRIAKNTMLLYFRMILIMGVMLYMSRVVLDKLGVDDFGLYNVVGGVVGMLSFINGTLSIGTSRFLTFELGRNDTKKLYETFNTAFYTHLLVGIILAILLETAGLWFVYNKLIIPVDRMDAAIVVYHISILTSIVSIAQVPYTSLIMAYERMGIYAYISIFEAIGKLGVVYLLSISQYDKLIVYAVLIAVVQVLTSLAYVVYCNRFFVESRLSFIFNNSIFKSLMGFSGWNIMANLAETLKLQGYLVLLNMFFQPFVVAAQTIGNQVAGAMMQFINNFRTAINPQVIKLYAAGEYEESKRLTLSTTVFVFDLVLLLGLPTIFVMEPIMKLWLVDVPPYTVVFTQYIVVQRILSTFDASFYIPMMAAGKIKTNSVISSCFGPGLFVLLYVMFRLGFDVMWLQYTGVIVTCLFSFYIKPYILTKEVVGYEMKDFIPCYMLCIKEAVLAIAISYCAYIFVGIGTPVASITTFVISLLGVVITSYIFMEKAMKEKVLLLIRKKLHRA